MSGSRLFDGNRLLASDPFFCPFPKAHESKRFKSGMPAAVVSTILILWAKPNMPIARIWRGGVQARVRIMGTHFQRNSHGSFIFQKAPGVSSTLNRPCAPSVAVILAYKLSIDFPMLMCSLDPRLSMDPNQCSELVSTRQSFRRTFLACKDRLGKTRRSNPSCMR